MLPALFSNTSLPSSRAAVTPAEEEFTAEIKSSTVISEVIVISASLILNTAESLVTPKSAIVTEPLVKPSSLSVLLLVDVS
ncbi:unknown [Clostridium sp. CAG:306]|nr:unknown [Clostridium sp. CAG:306]